MYTGLEHKHCRIPGVWARDKDSAQVINFKKLNFVNTDTARIKVLPQTKKTSSKSLHSTFISLVHMHNAIFSTYIYLEKKFALMILNNAFSKSTAETRALMKDSTLLNLEEMKGSLFDNDMNFYDFKLLKEIYSEQYL